MTQGIICPHCRNSSESEVTHTTRIEGAIVRYRKCEVCGMPYSTEEKYRKHLPEITISGKSETEPSLQTPGQC